MGRQNCIKYDFLSKLESRKLLLPVADGNSLKIVEFPTLAVAKNNLRGCYLVKKTVFCEFHKYFIAIYKFRPYAKELHNFVSFMLCA